MILNSKRVVDEMTKLVNEKLVIEKDLSNSSSGSEDNPETFFNNLWTSLNTNESAQLIKKYLDGPLSTYKLLVELFVRYNTPIPSIAAVERMFSLKFYFN